MRVSRKTQDIEEKIRIAREADEAAAERENHGINQSPQIRKISPDLLFAGC